MEIDQHAATSADIPQFDSAAAQSITHSEPVSATSLDVEPPLVLTPLAFKSRQARMSSINAATSLPQHLESHPPHARRYAYTAEACLACREEAGKTV